MGCHGVPEMPDGGRVGRVGGVILCGGESRRMGRPKAWLTFGGERMLQRVVRILRGVVEPVVVVAAPGQDLPPLPPETDVVRDARSGRGPLEGLAAGLTRIAELGADAAYASSTDVPFLEPAFVCRLIELLGDAAITVPCVAERHHPLAAVYRTAVLPEIERLLAADRLRPFFLFESVATRIVQPCELTDVDPAFRSLRNLNTPDDYEAALRELGGSNPPA
jgi:molybdopterin-guanine dinucleotide biosynthesis protein A